ncbi:hypothetical protein FNO01nite_26300 [Flavobacterium noncentrifugens]|uniref:SEC-C motif-containing protein n=1 Tax=Flavobacterium noncentrifugens TaxID=1128970 RepID=A0A1G8ZHD1_9FLAO|nr:SEC-C domain-containing protein [Flavobacterium noncentrifugens]GEP51958.1 hypothetical protein FNO01nite_26300 [Flavobacterium noncentrifugens]SDK13795.1 SEC-C motif-containing protein [Flavobacterium noncentrifugens]
MKTCRNDSCPCGSGKKYKKCCLNKENTFHVNNENPMQPNSFFAKYNSIDMLQTIAGLSILPKNDGKYVRMELITHEIITNYNLKDDLVTSQVFEEYVSKQYPSNHNEEIPVNLFTDLVTFHGGDYLIFPGITEGGEFILSNLLATIFQWPDSSIQDNFRSNAFQVSLLLLKISNRIATKMGYTRYLNGEKDSNKMFFPNDEVLNQVKSAVTFSEDEMNELLKENSISKFALQKFIVDINDNSFKSQFAEESPLLSKPILYKDGKYIVISPATLSFALTNFIWQQAIEMDCMDIVNEAYHNFIWNHLQYRLGQMKYERINDFNIPETDLPIKEHIYQFDDDKIAYIQLIYDAGKNFNESDVFIVPTTIYNRKQDVITQLQQITAYKNFKIFDLTITSGIGRSTMSHKMVYKDVFSLPIPLYEFEVLASLKDTDAIDLWKFSHAKETQINDTPFIDFSFLDQYQVYKDHNDSFYLSDDTKDVFLNPTVGYAAEVIKDSKLLTDKHSSLHFTDNRLGFVPVERKDKFAPIYVYVMGLASSQLELLIEGFHQPIWVKPKSISKGSSSELSRMYWEMTDAIAYWLWQIQDEIKDDLMPLGDKPLFATFSFDNENSFDVINRNFTREENLLGKFQTSATDNSFEIVIPSQILPYLYGSENEGERILLKCLILSINKLLTLHDYLIISEERVIKIIEDCAPLGMKKKIFILDTQDNLLLDLTNLVEKRNIQKYDVEVINNLIVPGLGVNCPPIGEIKSKEEKEKLAINIVVKTLLPLLKKKLSQYNSQELLQKLISLNESLIRKREFLRILVPTRIACFISVEQQIIELKESLGDINRTTVATRCLI